LGVAPRVRFTGYLAEEALLDYLGRCRGVVFVPEREDYGFVTVEAFASGKAVITTTDSGGPAELVRDASNGFVVDPTPAAVAQAMAALYGDADLAARLGHQGRADTAHLTWPETVTRLLASP
jgi:glycosyltransferase involved in cell wall biosynthesis